MMWDKLHEATRKGNIKKVRSLLESGCDANARDLNGQTPLIKCSKSGKEVGVGLARLFLEFGASVGFKDLNGCNALHHACLCKRHDLVKLYLNAVDFDLNSADNNSNTVLHCSIWKNDIVALKMLITSFTRYGLSLDHINKFGDTAFSLAKDLKYFDCAECLINASARTSVRKKRLAVHNDRPQSSLEAFSEMEHDKPSISKPYAVVSSNIREHNDRVPPRPQSVDVCLPIFREPLNYRELHRSYSEEPAKALSYLTDDLALENDPFNRPRKDSKGILTSLLTSFNYQRTSSYLRSVKPIPMSQLISKRPSAVFSDASDISVVSRRAPSVAGSVVNAPRRTSSKKLRHGTNIVSMLVVPKK